MPNDVVSRAIDAVCAGDHLTADHASAVLAEIMEGRAEPVQTGAFLIALRAKGETVPELVGLARTMRSLAAPVSSSRPDLVDTAGSGGGPTTFNVSTAAALVAAGAGCAVAKHGNRSATTNCGSADLLEAFGVNIELEPEQVGRCIDELGFGFMFAPRHHTAMAHVIPARKALGVRTIFNFLGPLTNPAGANRQLIGIADRHYQETIAEALLGLGAVRALVVSADDGLDELSLSSRTRVIEVADGGTAEWFVEPGQFGLAPVRIEDVAGGSPERNAATVRAVLAGEPGPARDLTLLNAAAAIYVGGLAPDLEVGVAKAAEAIDSAAAADVLKRLIAATAAAADWASSVQVGMIEQLIAGARQGVDARRRELPQSDLEARLSGRGEGRPFSEALTRPGLSLIAEFKRRSPSAGEISAGAEVPTQVRAYENGGAAALSVLTDEPHFGGSLEDLRAARAACSLPIIRKDFIVDPYQLYEAAVNGADAVLLIVRALDDGELRALYEEARAIDLDCLVEVHDAEELERALAADVEVVGINNRDLDQGAIDLDTTFELMPDVPAGKTVVAESGISGRAELEELERVGVDAVLIGGTLMATPDPEAKVLELLGGDEGTREHRF